jgi:hypothetical protein
VIVDGYGDPTPDVPVPGTLIVPLEVNVVFAGIKEVNATLLPKQMVALVGVISGAGGVAFTTAVAVFVQPVAVIVPVTVYVVFTVGLATTVAPVVALNPAAGDQL